MNAPMNIDEALLLADDMAAVIPHRTPGIEAMLVLAATVREQHRELERLRELLNAAGVAR